MLHMIVAKHGPETCAYASERIREIALDGASRLHAAAQDNECAVRGGWTNRSSHTLYALIDAPHAHAVEQLLFELRFPEWMTVHIEPVYGLEETLAL